MRHAQTLFLALNLLSCSTATTQMAAVDAQSENPPSNHDGPLGSMLQETLEAPTLPAVAALVSQRGDIHDGVAGVRAIGDATRAELTDVWHLGSCGKAMTATLLVRLAESGGVNLDTKLRDIFAQESWFRAEYNDVTLEMLLQHRGGIIANVRSLNAYRASSDSLLVQRASAAREALSVAPTGVGTFSYSNLGYMIVAHALERQTQRSYEDLLQEQVFAPLQMTSCVFGHPGSETAVTQPRAHDEQNGELIALVPGTSDNPVVMRPAGGIACSLRDWAKFVQLHIDGVAGRANSFLPRSTFERLHQLPTGGDYAAGWTQIERPWAGGTAWTHSGSNTVNYAVVWAAPSRNWFVLVATNRGEARNASGDPVYSRLDQIVSSIAREYQP